MASHPFSLCLCLAGLFALTVGAQTPPPATTSPGAEDTRSGRRTRQMSPELSAALAAGVKYEAPAPQRAPEPDEDLDSEDTDLREIDRPRNTIIRLPKYVVEGERPAVFTERELNTGRGLADLAVKRYLSGVHTRLNRFTLPSILGGISNEALAMEMYREEERLQNIRAFDERVYLYRQAGDEEAADALQDDAQRTFMRKSDFPDPPRANGK